MTTTLVQIESLARLGRELPAPRLPDWLRKPQRHSEANHNLKRMFRTRGLHTVCEEARCPNRHECFAKGAATFMILGDTCSRSCGFCAVKTGRGLSLDSLIAEPRLVAEAAAELRLKYVVITSVNRDELPDGGAGHFARTIRAVRHRLPAAKVEVLTPDFKGSRAAVRTVLEAEPDTFNHNIETVPRLYDTVRPQARYQQSLDVLAYAATLTPGVLIKSGLMVGLGETEDEVMALLGDLHRHGVQVVTIGQYLQPTRKHLPVIQYIRPEQYEAYRGYGERLGFRAVFAGPFVRSSYMAEMVHENLESR
jgi:lipoic acid synthetase